MTIEQALIIIIFIVLFLSLFSSKKKSQALSLAMDKNKQLENQIISFKTGSDKLKTDLETEKEATSILKLLVKLDPERIVKNIKELTAELEKYKALYFDILEELENLKTVKNTDKNYVKTLETELKKLKKYMVKITKKGGLDNGIFKPA